MDEGIMCVQDIFNVESDIVCFRVPYERLHEVIDVLNTYGYRWRGGGEALSVRKPAMEDQYRLSERYGMNPHIVLRFGPRRVSWDHEGNVMNYTHVDDGMNILLGELDECGVGEAFEPMDLTTVL